MISLINYSQCKTQDSFSTSKSKMDSLPNNFFKKTNDVFLNSKIQMISFNGKKLDSIPFKEIKDASVKSISKILHADDISKLEKSDVAIFMAHPDDEIFFMVIPELIKKGHSVQLVYAACGDKGLRNEGAPAGRKELAEHREKELLNALKKLNINREPIMLDLPDLEVYKGENPQKLHTLCQKILDKTKPDYVFTFAPDGMTQNPDHIKVGETVFNLVKKASPDGPKHLYHSVISKKSFVDFKENMKNCNTYSWDFLKFVPDNLIKLKSEASKYANIIFDSASQHRSQWNTEELKGFQDFYSNNPSEFITLKKFKTKKTLTITMPWEEKELKFKKKYGEEFSILLSNGVGFQPKGSEHKFPLYLADFGHDKETLWLEDPSYIAEYAGKAPIDSSKDIFKNINKIKKIPRFKDLKYIAFNILPQKEGADKTKLIIPVDECKKIAPYISDFCIDCDKGLNKYLEKFPNSNISIGAKND